MKTQQSALIGRGPALMAISIILCLAASALRSFAADITWDGGGDQVNWSASPQNWVGDVAPAANDQLFFDGNIGLTPNNDFTTAPVITSITFNAAAGAFTLSGTGIRWPSGSGTIGVMTNFSPNTQTVSLNVTNNGGPRIYNAAVGPIILNGIINNNSIIKEGTSALTIAGVGNVGSPGATVNNGTLILAKSSGNAFASTITVNTNAILRIIGNVSPLDQDQIHFNQRVIMNAGIFQMQHWNGSNAITLEEIASLSGSNLNSIVENGLVGTTNRIDIGGGNNHRGIYSGIIRDGAAGMFAFRVYRGNNYEELDGTNTYSGTTQVDNTQAAGAARLIVNGKHTGGGAYSVFGSATDATRQAYLHGNGTISASVINIGANGYVSPGGSLSADLVDSATFTDSAAILTISNAVNLNAASSTVDVQLNGTTAGTTYDQVNLAGSSGSLSNNSVNLKLTLGYSPASGDKFTIVQVQGTSPTNNVGIFGSLNGVPTDLSQGATFIEPSSGQNFQISYRAEGSTFDAGVSSGNDIMLRVVSSAGTNLVWRGDINNVWDITTTANWRNSGGVALTFTNGDNVTFNDFGSNSVPIDLQGDLSPGNITVNSTNNYVFDSTVFGKLTGTVVVTKTNTGKLTILTDNNNAGSTLVKQGTVQIGTNAFTGILGGNLNISSSGTVIFSRADSSTYSGTIAGNGRVIQSGDGTTILTADSTTFGGTVSVNSGTLQLGDGSGISGSISAMVTNKATVTYDFNNTVTINNSLSGTGLVNFVNSTATAHRFNMGAGPSSLTNSAFSGTFHVIGPVACLATPDLSNGTNQLGVGSKVYIEDTCSVLLDRAGTYLSTFYIQGSGNGAGNAGTSVALEIEGIGPPTTIAGDVFVLSDTIIGGFIGTSRIAGRLVDTNDISKVTFANGRAGSSFNLQLGSSSGPNHWGNTVIDPDINSGQTITITAMAAQSISTNGLTIGAHGVLALNGFNHTVASLAGANVDGTFYPSVLNSSATTPGVLTVGTDDSSTTFVGVFGNGGTASLGMTKVGAGTLTLSGNSSSTGPVTVSGGSISLTADGSFSNATPISVSSGAVLDVTTRNDGNLNLQNGQTLKGNGGVNGNLVTLAGSIVNPGSSIGTLTVSNNATLGGTLLMEVNRASVPNCDHIVVGGTLTTGGTLAVTNIGAALQVNDTFALFPSGIGGFTVSLPSVDYLNGVSYTWQNDVAANGSVKVLSVTPIAAPTLGMSRSGDTLTFSWSGPFKLQSQTNSVNVGLSTNWSDYPGGGSSSVNVTINPANPTVFFRLSLQ